MEKWIGIKQKECGFYCGSPLGWYSSVVQYIQSLCLFIYYIFIYLCVCSKSYWFRLLKSNKLLFILKTLKALKFSTECQSKRRFEQIGMGKSALKWILGDWSRILLFNFVFLSNDNFKSKPQLISNSLNVKKRFRWWRLYNFPFLSVFRLETPLRKKLKVYFFCKSYKHPLYRSSFFSLFKQITCLWKNDIKPYRNAILT